MSMSNQADQSFIRWIALPNGYDGSRRLSVLVSPQIAATSLPDAFHNWPDTLRVQVKTFKITFGGLGGNQTTVDVPSQDWSRRFDGELWRTLFDEKTPVRRPRKSSLDRQQLRSYRTRTIGGRVRQSHTALALAAASRSVASFSQPSPGAAAGVPADLLTEHIKGHQLFLRPVADAATRASRDQAQAVLDQELANEVKGASPAQLESNALPTGLRLAYARLVDPHLRFQSRGQASPSSPPDRLLTRGAIRALLEIEHPEVDWTQLIPCDQGETPQHCAEVRTAMRFALFHRQLAPHVSSVRMQQLPDQMTPPHFDFHQRLALAMTEPDLLRPLGLAFDLDLDPTTFPTAPASAVSVSPVGSIPGFTPYSPKTAYALAGGSSGTTRFVPEHLDAATGGYIVAGLLDLAAADAVGGTDSDQFDDGYVFHLEVLDVDGAALKTMHTAEDLARAQAFRTTDSPKTEPVATLRSAGISLVMKDRDQLLSMAAKRTTDAQQAIDDGNDLLYAEDLLLGYRPDVLSSELGQWHSLCQRIGHLEVKSPDGSSSRRFPAAADASLRSEGVVHLAASRPADSATQLKLRDSLFRWDNWSVSVGLGDQPMNPCAAPAPKEQAIRGCFEVADGSLPALRFGVRYRVRCRTVDLAGNGLRLADCDDQDSSRTLGGERDTQGQSPDLVYLRHEPVLAPVVLLAGAVDLGCSPGEQMVRPVIRDRDCDPARRFLVPPRVGQAFAELHGAFDRADGSGELLPGAFSGVKLDDDGSFPKVVPDPEPPRPVQPCAGVAPRPPAHPAPPPRPPAESNAYFAPAPAYDGVGSLAAPSRAYYPDPMAAGCILRLFDHLQQHVGDAYHDFYAAAKWPDALPLVVHLAAAGPGDTTTWLAGGQGRVEVHDGIRRRKLEVRVPPGETATVEISCLPSDLDRLFLWQSLEAAQLPQLEQAAKAGLHPMLTPSQTLTLVHAVKAPQQAPVWSSPGVERAAPGDTFARPRGKVTCHAPSTSRLDFAASWCETVDDDPQHPGPVEKKQSAPAFHLDLHPESDASNGEIDLAPLTGLQHEFRDTKHRQVTYRLSAAPRYAEYYRHPLQAVPGTTFQATICSSAAPAKPEIVYVMPTFRWERTDCKDEILSVRWGGGIRVYLARPWFSSGDGELLGAIVWPGPDDAPKQRQGFWRGGRPASLPDLLAPVVSRWGMDPIWASQPPQVLTVHDFKNVAVVDGKLMVRHGISLAPSDQHGTTPFRVSVAGFQPAFDADRQLWFCDIEMDPTGSYFPFVRLALARFQWHSLPGVEISPVVQADFLQLAPDRWASLQWLDRCRGKIRLAVYGFTYDGSQLGPGGSEVSISIQEQAREIDGADHDMGWLPVPGPWPGHQPTLTLSPADFRNGMTIWATDFTLSRWHTHRQRILIEEYESHYADDRDNPHDPAATKRYRRLVYADALEI